MGGYGCSKLHSQVPCSDCHKRCLIAQHFGCCCGLTMQINNQITALLLCLFRSMRVHACVRGLLSTPFMLQPEWIQLMLPLCV